MQHSNRKFSEEALTKRRCQLKKRKNRQDFAQARQLWRKESESLRKVAKICKKQLLAAETQRKFAGKFVAPSGRKKLILMEVESQDKLEH